MKARFYLVSLFLFCLIVTACSPIDSVRPFDQEQAAKLIKNIQKKSQSAQRKNLNQPINSQRTN
jgi:hypothetical protein